MCQNHLFKPSLLTIALSGIFTSVGLYAYQQGVAEVAIVEKGEIVTKIDAVTTDQPKSKVGGELNRSGNPVRIIWYGNPNDNDSKIAQTGALNKGIIHGKVVAQGQRSGGGKDEYWASINVEGQANAIDALGWSAPSNPNSIDINIKSVENQRTAIGEAQLKGGLSTVHGKVDSLGTANGISVVGTADFGRSGIDGFSGATGQSSSASVDSSSSGPTLDDLLKENTGSAIPVDTYESDMFGKNIKTILETVTNLGEIVGSLHSQASQEVKSPYLAEYAPQFYGVDASASGNGVSVATHIDTVDKYTYSEDKLNYAALGVVRNSGSINGQALLEGGKNVTHTQTKSRGAANGISAFAATGRFAKNSTSSQILDVDNNGQIVGKLTQKSGNNSGYKSNHLLSTAEAYGSGNGISAFTETFNGQTKQAQSLVKKVNNTGRIEGVASLKAGTNGTGDMSITASAVGNGISSYSQRGNAITGDVVNRGLILGNVETYAGTSAGAAKDGELIPTQETKLFITRKDTYSSKADPLPEKPIQARALTYSERLNKTDRSETTILGSGNGISTLQRNNETAYMGHIDNQGVISGYAKLYHGFSEGNYNRVNFLGVGTGIYLSGKTQGIVDKALVNSNIINTGIISGNHSALLVAGKLNDAYSRTPIFESGYLGKVENYGVMAGVMIAGNYAPMQALSSSEQTYRYFEADVDPVKNSGIFVYLKPGIELTPAAYWYASPTKKINKDDESIDRVVIGSAETYTNPQGATYRVINGKLSSDQKDSDYTTTDTSLSHTIINGVGLQNGALYTTGTMALNNSIINGYRTALNIKSGGNVDANNTIFNTNGFSVNRHLPTYAVLGDDGDNTLKLTNNSIVNGNINLKEGSDTLYIQDNSVQINSKIIDLGMGYDKLIFGSRLSPNNQNEKPIRISYHILNAENLEINQPTEVVSTAKIEGTNTVTLNSNLLYYADNAKRHSFYSENKNQDLKFLGQGTMIFDVTNQDQKIDFGNLNVIVDKDVSLKSSNVLQTVELKEHGFAIVDKQAEIERKKAEEERIKAELLAKEEAENAKKAEEARLQAEELAKKTKEEENRKALILAQENAKEAIAAANTAKEAQHLAEEKAALAIANSEKDAQAKQFAELAKVEAEAKAKEAIAAANAAKEAQRLAEEKAALAIANSEKDAQAKQFAELAKVEAEAKAKEAIAAANTAKEAQRLAEEKAALAIANSEKDAQAKQFAELAKIEAEAKAKEAIAAANAAKEAQRLAEEKIKEAVEKPQQFANKESINNSVLTEKFNDNLALLQNTDAAKIFLQNSSSLINKGQDLTQPLGLINAENIAKQAVNDYLDKVRNQNIYAALPSLILDNMNSYRNKTVDTPIILKKGDISTQISSEGSENYYKAIAEKSTSRLISMDFAYGANDNIVLGTNLGTGKTRLSGNQGSYLKGDSLYASLYLVTTHNNFAATIGAAYGQLNLNGKRIISNGYDAHEFDIKMTPKVTELFTQVKYDIPFGAFTYTPKAGIAYSNLKINKLTEKGNGGLIIQNQNTNNIELLVGQNIQFSLPVSQGQLLTRFSMDYIRSTQMHKLKVNFQNGNTFELNDESTPNKLNLGLATEFHTHSGLSLGVGAKVDAMRRAGNSWNINANLGYIF